MSNVVSIHPYFQVRAGNLEAAKALLPRFIERTSTEPLCLQYDFTINDHQVFCRESYAGAEGALAHLANVQEILAEMLALSELVRLEIHGPAAELDPLRGPLAALNPAWFTYECGLPR